MDSTEAEGKTMGNPLPPTGLAGGNTGAWSSLLGQSLFRQGFICLRRNSLQGNCCAPPSAPTGGGDWPPWYSRFHALYMVVFPYLVTSFSIFSLSGHIFPQHRTSAAFPPGTVSLMRPVWLVYFNPLPCICVCVRVGMSACVHAHVCVCMCALVWVCVTVCQCL